MQADWLLAVALHYRQW